MGKHIFLEDVHIIQRIRIHDDGNKKYYRVQPCIDSVTGKENNNYYWVRKRDENNKLVENIYDVNNDKFILNEWIYDAGHGLINGHYANLIKVDEIRQTEFYNNIDQTNMKIMHSKW